MTVHVARRRSKGQAAMSGGESLSMPIGEIDQTLFGCPSCGRPLAIGVRKCPGCSARLVMGIQLSRATTFVMIGLVLGVAFGGGLAAALSAMRLPAHDAQVAQTAAAEALAAAALVHPSAAPTANPGTTTPGSTGGTATIPAISASSLSQALSVDLRLTEAKAGLQAALAGSRFRADDVSQLLRNASSESVIGLQLARNLNPWPAARGIGDRLSSFYDAVQATASDGLAASIRNETAYRQAASKMVALLGSLEAIDGQARELASSANVSLPIAVSPAP